MLPVIYEYVKNVNGCKDIEAYCVAIENTELARGYGIFIDTADVFLLSSVITTSFYLARISSAGS